MKKYTVIWEVSKYATVEAETAEDAIEQIMSGDDIESFEDEMTTQPEAVEEN